VDREAGFVLMEDLGARTYLPELDGDSVDALYADALDALLRMQAQVDVAGLPPYDRTRLVAEMELLPEWFLGRHLGFTPDCDEWDIVEAAFTFLVHAALEQPRAFVHRDFHSRNLLVVPRETGADALASPAIIDFQDAVVGPVTYDLVSLLRDCYIEWDAARVDGWIESHRLRLRAAHLIGPDTGELDFRRWVDLMGAQRHLKVLGIFCRLWYRDGKAQYLADLPRVWRYAMGVMRRYPELGAFAGLLEKALGGRDIAQPRAGDAA
jgi:aminoglycoside/choline kinase family phosphotransferase